MSKSIRFLYPNIKSILFFACLCVHHVVSAEDLQGQWIDSESLTPGMKIVTSDNRELVVEESWVQRNDVSTTYNFEVEKNHTYFVSENNVWVHNSCYEVNSVRNMRMTLVVKPKPGAISTSRSPKMYEKPVEIVTRMHKETGVREKIVKTAVNSADDINQVVSQLKIHFVKPNASVTHTTLQIRIANEGNITSESIMRKMSSSHAPTKVYADDNGTITMYFEFINKNAPIDAVFDVIK